MALSGHAEREGYNLSLAALNAPDGAARPLAHLHARFGGSRLDEKHTAMLELHACHRGQQSMEEYLTRFDAAVHACENAGVGVPLELLAHQVLQQANLTHDEATVVMSTVKADARTRGVITYDEMQAALTLLHGQRAKAWAGASSSASVTLTAEEHRALMAAASRGGSGSAVPKPADLSKMRCWHCHEMGHARRNCPARARRDPADIPAAPPPADERALYTTCGVRSTLMCRNGDVPGRAIIDPGATATVAGAQWVALYKAAFSEAERATARSEAVDVVFRFGDGGERRCGTVAVLPVSVGQTAYMLRVHVVPGGLPLLLSRDSLRRARAVLDMDDDTLFMKDTRCTVPLDTNAAGHLTLVVLPIAAPRGVVRATAMAAKVTPAGPGLASVPAPVVSAASPNLPATAERLHKTYGHAGAARISALLRQAGCDDPAVHAAVEAAVKSCRACQLAQPAPHHPTVAMPRSSRFNDTVALDLASIRGLGMFVHFIDLGTRLSRCVSVSNKLSQTVVRAFLEAWICVYGAPREVLADGGGELQNDLFRLLSERFNIAVSTTAAQAAWSNGVCERHNAVVKRMVEALRGDHPDATFQDLLSHATFAKNNLTVHGTATPYQLVTGTLPRLPSVLTDGLPAMHNIRVKDDDHLRATIDMLSSARAALARAEADQSLRRALNSPPSRNHNTLWPLGTQVDYWAEGLNPDKCGWRGPATVAGQVGKQVRLRHGASWTTRHSQSLRLSGGPDKDGVVSDGLPNAAAGAQPARVPLEPGQDVDRSGHPDDGVHDMLQRAAAAVQANANIADAQAGTDPSCHARSPVLAGDRLNQTAALQSCFAAAGSRAVRFADGPHPGDGSMLGRLTGRALAHSLRAGAGNLRAQLEKLHAQWMHPAAAVTTSRLRLNGVRDPQVLSLAVDVAEACALCARPADAEVAAGSGDDNGGSPEAAGHEAIDDAAMSARRYSALITRREQRRRTEVSLAEAGSRFDAAIDAELDAWSQRTVYTEERDRGQRVLSTRWVLTIKAPQLPTDPPRLKARLCVRGFEDPDRTLVERESPTVSRATVRLVIAAAVAHGWVLRTVDVSTAFLQGMPINRPCPVFVRPPMQARVPSGTVWRLNKCAYGLTDAPRAWYNRVVALLESINAERVEADYGLFVLHKATNLVLVVAVHVDDFLFCGTASGVSLFESALRDAFTVGPVAVGTFTFTGLRVVTRMPAPGVPLAVSVDQDAYIDSIDDITIEPSRARDASLAVTATELTDYRRATGALLWATGQTLPQLACATALLARRFKDARVADLVRANKVIKLVRLARGMPLTFLPTPPQRHLVLFTDSSAVTVKAPVSQAGFAVFLTPSSPVNSVPLPDGRGPCTLVAWGSHRQRRVTHSSFAAEAFALLHGLQSALLVSSAAGCLMGGPERLPIPIHVVIDSLGVYESLSSGADAGSKEVRAVVEDLRDYYRSGAMATVTWMPGRFQLADGLTKPTGAAGLCAAMATGALSLRSAGSRSKCAGQDPSRS